MRENKVRPYVFRLHQWQALRKGTGERDKRQNPPFSVKKADRYLFGEVPAEFIELVVQARNPNLNLKALAKIRQIERKAYLFELGQDAAWKSINIQDDLSFEILNFPIAPLDKRVVENIWYDMKCEGKVAENEQLEHLMDWDGFAAGVQREKVDMIIRHLSEQGFPVRLPSAHELIQLNIAEPQYQDKDFAELIIDDSDLCYSINRKEIFQLEETRCPKMIGFRLVKIRPFNVKLI